MKRLGNSRRRATAFALLPVAALMFGSPSAVAGERAGAQAASLDASSKRVAVGTTVKLRGRFTPRRVSADATSTALTPTDEPASSRFVRIEFRPSGNGSWRKARVVKTDRKGRFARSVRIRRSGSFRAVSADDRATDPIRVRAQARVRARVAGQTVKLGDRVPIKGTVVPGAGREVVVKVGDDVLRTRSGRSGGFKVKWDADQTGGEQIRVKAKGDDVAAGAATMAGRVTVLRPAIASWYGPGLYGNGTACGKETLTPTTIGVAHKTLPCGTKLTIGYRNRTVEARVIDRGPYSGDREFDLTYATKEKLGFDVGVGTIWVSK